MIRPLVIRGSVWRVARVSPGNPFLIDRTGVLRIATTDPVGKVIRISYAVPASLFDQVYIHEAAHAMMIEAGITDVLWQVTEERRQVLTEEMLAWFLEHHAIEVIDAVSQSLGRRVCVDERCL